LDDDDSDRLIIVTGLLSIVIGFISDKVYDKLSLHLYFRWKEEARKMGHSLLPVGVGEYRELDLP
jgi:hypothetical protein